MRLMTKAEACRELRLSLSTLNLRIADGEMPVRREPHGRRHRVYVVLDDEPPSSEYNLECGGTALAVAPGADTRPGGAGCLAPRATGAGAAAQRRVGQRAEGGAGTARTQVAILVGMVMMPQDELR